MITSGDVFGWLTPVVTHMKGEGVTTGEVIEWLTPVIAYIICSVILLAVLPRQRID